MTDVKGSGGIRGYCLTKMVDRLKQTIFYRIGRVGNVKQSQVQRFNLAELSRRD